MVGKTKKVGNRKTCIFGFITFHDSLEMQSSSAGLSAMAELSTFKVEKTPKNGE